MFIKANRTAIRVFNGCHFNARYIWVYLLLVALYVLALYILKKRSLASSKAVGPSVLAATFLCVVIMAGSIAVLRPQGLEPLRTELLGPKLVIDQPGTVSICPVEDGPTLYGYPFVYRSELQYVCNGVSYTSPTSAALNGLFYVAVSSLFVLPAYWLVGRMKSGA